MVTIQLDTEDELETETSSTGETETSSTSETETSSTSETETEKPSVNADKESSASAENSADENSEQFVYDVVADKILSKEKVGELINTNKNKDVVIKSNNNILFTFAKGTMSLVEGVENYDFSTVVNNEYDATKLPKTISKDNFVSIVTYNYSGKLPAKAAIKIYVGKDYEGKTLNYSFLKEDKSLAETQTVKVDVDGYITVAQDHCSDYVITLDVPSDKDVQDNLPKTGDSTSVAMYVAFLMFGLTLIVAMRKRKTV